MTTGTFYRTDGDGFPAVLVKVLDGDLVLVCAFTNGGPLTDVAVEAASGTAAGTFIRDMV
jgi:hypothetical protein